MSSENKLSVANWAAIGAVAIGGAGFLAGFVLPLRLTPGANQGPLTGFCISGPLGFLVGAAVGAIAGRWSGSRVHAVWILWVAAGGMWVIVFAMVYPYRNRPGWRASEPPRATDSAGAGSLVVTASSPPAGGVVRERTVVEASIRYAIQPRHAGGRYEIAAYLEPAAGSVPMRVPVPETALPEGERQGTVEVVTALHPISRFCVEPRRLGLAFALVEQLPDENHSQVVAWSAPLVFVCDADDGSAAP